MTDQKTNLALTFLQSHPDFVAGVLEKWPIEEVAAFMKDIPHPYGASVLNHMLPQYTARLCKFLEIDSAAGFLSQMESSLIAAVLRYTDKKVRRNLLKELPLKIQTTCKLLLTYQENSAGAWMISQVATVPGGCTIEEALTRLSEDQESVIMDPICVIDRERQVLGVIELSALLRTKPEILIDMIMHKKPATVSGRASLTTIQHHNGWLAHGVLPVVNRTKQLVGMLRHRDLHKGLRQIATTITEARNSNHLIEIWEVYGGTLLTLFNTVGSITSSKSH